jgi:hypothetical protein
MLCSCCVRDHKRISIKKFALREGAEGKARRKFAATARLKSENHWPDNEKRRASLCLNEVLA